MKNLTEHLKIEFNHLLPREILQASPEILLGMSPEAVDALRALNIQTIFDLATSQIFANARLIHLASSDPTHFIAQSGQVPKDLFHTDPPVLPISDLQHQSVELLKGIGPANGPTLTLAIGVNVIRDLAFWPPYSTAQEILQSEYFLETISGFDTESPEDLLPRSGEYPTERIFYETLVIDEIQTDPDQLNPLESAGPIDLSPAINTDFGFNKPAVGAMLTLSQSWYAEGVALGQLLHSIALAPGESTRIALYDWRRDTSGSREENVFQRESLSNTTQHSRALSEVTKAVATEAQRGFSSTQSTSTSSQEGSGAGIGIGPISFGSSDASATNTTEATSFASSFGRRELAASYAQKVMDRTQQHANSARNRRASVVQEISQSEHEAVSTRVITNYNHMHALSVQYYEMVQIYRVVVELAGVEQCLFIPMKLINFRKKEAGQYVFIEKYKRVLAKAAVDEYAYQLLTSEFGVVEVMPQTPSISLIDVVSIDKDSNAGNQTNNIAETPAPDLPSGITRATSPNLSQSPSILNGTTPLMAIMAAKGWNLNQVNTISSLIGKPILKKDKDSLFLPDDMAIIGLALTGVQSDEIHINLKSQATPLEFTGSERIQFSPPISIADLDSISIKYTGNSNVKTHLILHLNYYGTRFPLDIPIQLVRNTRLQRVIQFSISRASRELVEHLERNQLHYSKAVFQNLDTASLALLLSPYKYKDQPVLQLIDPLPVTVAGNYLVFKMHPEAIDADGPHGDTLTEWGNWLKERGLDKSKIKEDIIPLPSGGVFAEAVLGRYNSAEKLDLTRFWNWQDSPIPIQAPEIAAIQLGSRVQAEDLKAGDFSQPIVNIQNPTALPDPSGLESTLKALMQSNLFRDMSGLANTITLAQESLKAASTGATNAGTQAQANLKVAAEKQIEMFKAALSFMSTLYGGSGAGLKGNSNISTEGAKVNHGKKLDEKKSRNSSGGSQNPSGSKVSPNLKGSSGGGDNNSSIPISTTPSSGLEDAAFKNLVHGPMGVPAGDTLDQLVSLASSTDSSRSFIILNNDHTPEARAFNPFTDEKAGEVQISVRVPNLPAGGSIRWSVPPGHIGKYMLAGGGNIQFGNKAEILGLRPGITEIDVEVIDSQNQRIESSKFPLCIPQFVAITENAAEFDAALTAMGVYQLKDGILDEAKRTCDYLLRNANVRTVWQVGLYAEAMPNHLPPSFYSTLLIGGEPPSGQPGLGGVAHAVNGSGGWDVPNQPIFIYPGALDNQIPGGDPTYVETQVVALVTELINMNFSDPVIEQFAVKVFGRLIGEIMAHEIVYILLWDELHRVDTTGHTGLDSLMDSGGLRTFRQRTGIEDVAYQSPLDVNNFIDHGIAAIGQVHPNNQAYMNQRFPVPPVFT